MLFQRSVLQSRLDFDSDQSVSRFKFFQQLEVQTAITILTGRSASLRVWSGFKLDRTVLSAALASQSYFEHDQRPVSLLAWNVADSDSWIRNETVRSGQPLLVEFRIEPSGQPLPLTSTCNSDSDRSVSPLQTWFNSKLDCVVSRIPVLLRTRPTASSISNMRFRF